MSELHDAMLWEAEDGQVVRCNLCGHRCKLVVDDFGICRVRQNVEGCLKTHSFGEVVAMNVDPIEKKPLFHFLPGTVSLSIAAAGCNFQCEFCQNWQISQRPRIGGSSGERRGQAVTPLQIVTAAQTHDCASISYTYTEPTIFFEMAYETGKLAHERGIKNSFVSNGYMTPRAVETIAPYLDAINVDLKAFRDETYRRVMHARLQPVLDCLKALVAAGVWVEVTTLVVPDVNDSEEELQDIAQFIARELGVHVPWHVSRFHGDYQMTSSPPTPLETLKTACALGQQAGLKYVYCGNVSGQVDERTICPRCSATVIDRVGFSVRRIDLHAGRCPSCGEAIEGVWE
ncbi:MAG: AmmeMemoRadiSam system radical SAM enzyme [Planctomycetota bacterium]|jgi:pyruvate formate lyase activating enzyme